MSEYRPATYVTRPIKIAAMEIVKDDLDAQMAAFEWASGHIGTFVALPVIEGQATPPAQGISIDPRDGRFILAKKGKLKWGDDGDWLILKRTGEFSFCPPNLFKGLYSKGGRRV